MWPCPVALSWPYVNPNRILTLSKPILPKSSSCFSILLLFAIVRHRTRRPRLLTLSIHILSADIVSADILSADKLSADILSADILSADTLSADKVSADISSADILSADILSVDIFLD